MVPFCYNRICLFFGWGGQGDCHSGKAIFDLEKNPRVNVIVIYSGKSAMG